jgi:hypothetical protein
MKLAMRTSLKNYRLEPKAKAGRFLFRLKVVLPLRPPEEFPAQRRLQARWAP